MRKGPNCDYDKGNNFYDKGNNLDRIHQSNLVTNRRYIEPHQITTIYSPIVHTTFVYSYK